MYAVGKSIKRRGSSKSITRARTKKQIIDKPIPAEEVLKDIQKTLNRPDWAICLSGLRNRQDLTQKEMADILGLKQSNISAMEKGIRPIGKKLAMKIAELFGTNYRFFL